MCESTKQSVADMRKRCKDLVVGGDKNLKGYSKLSRAELTTLMNQLDNSETGAAVSKESEPIVLPVAAAKAQNSSLKNPVIDDGKTRLMVISKVKRAPSLWNTYCKDNNIAPGSSITQAQKDAYSAHKAALAVSS